MKKGENYGRKKFLEDQWNKKELWLMSNMPASEMMTVAARIMTNAMLMLLLLIFIKGRF